MGALAEPLDQPRLVAVGRALEAHQQPVAQARGACGLLVAVGREPRQGGVLARLGQAHPELSVGIALDHVGDAHVGQGAPFGEALAAATPQRPFRLQLAQHLAQRPPVGALQAEGLGEVGLFGLASLAQKAEKSLLVRETGRRSRGFLAGHDAPGTELATRVNQIWPDDTIRI